MLKDKRKQYSQKSKYDVLKKEHQRSQTTFENLKFGSRNQNSILGSKDCMINNDRDLFSKKYFQHLEHHFVYSKTQQKLVERMNE